MGLYDRDYTQAEDSAQRYGTPQFRLGFPPMTPAVKWLVIANVTVYIVGLVGPLGDLLKTWFALYSPLSVAIGRPWGLVTYEFLHETPWHIFFNMMGLYFLGPALEKQWGSRKFLLFYLLCGACGGLFYLILGSAGVLPTGLLLGASGSVLAILAACAVLFPHTTVVLWIFPMPIRLVAAGMLVVYTVSLFTGQVNSGGDAAHLGGMLAGAAFVLLRPQLVRLSLRTKAESSRKSLERERELQIEVDRILAKVHQSGLHSLTSKEKRTLQLATQEENKRRR
jgi:membrane associated rhomboid family serine protease